MIASAKNSAGCCCHTFTRTRSIAASSVSTSATVNLRQKSPAVVGSGITFVPSASLVLAALLQILQRLPAAQDVVGDVQDVVRLVVGLMHLQQPHMVVDRRRQPGALRQQLHRPDAARPETADASTALVVEVPPTEHRLQLCPPVTPTQPPPTSLLAPCLPLLYS